MSTLYYILGIIFLIGVIVICILNVLHYSDILYKSSINENNKDITGLSFNQLQALQVFNIIVAVLSLALALYYLSVLFMGSPKGDIEIQFDDSLGEAVLEQIVNKKYTKARNENKENPVEYAGEKATEEMILTFYKQGYSNYEANKKAKDFMIKTINKKFPSDIIELKYRDKNLNNSSVTASGLPKRDFYIGVVNAEIPWYSRFYNYLINQPYKGVVK